MKRILLLSTLLLAFSPLFGQRLARGEKMPELQVKQWISQSQPAPGKATLVEFFHSGNKTSVERLKALEELAKSNSSKLNVIVVTRENTAPVTQMLSGKSYFAVLDDEGKTFSAYSAIYVPYTVIADRRGRVVWLGNPTSITDKEIADLIK